MHSTLDSVLSFIAGVAFLFAVIVFAKRRRKEKL
jgi:LPXTG-motif cell wall-anchored protein